MVTTLDFHANSTDAMARHADALIGYDTYPHVDMYQRGREAVTVLADVLRGGARRAVAHRKVGLITPPQAQYSHAEPVRSIIERVHSLEAAEGLSVTVTPGFPYADIDSLGLSVLASSGDPLCAQQVADLVAADIEAHADEFNYTTSSSPMPWTGRCGPTARSPWSIPRTTSAGAHRVTAPPYSPSGWPEADGAHRVPHR